MATSQVVVEWYTTLDHAAVNLVNLVQVKLVLATSLGGAAITYVISYDHRASHP